MSGDRPPRATERHDGGQVATEPEVVDFDALHAALGDLPPPVAATNGDSSGRANASYASARPHAPPSTRPPLGDADAPAVIVAPEDTVPTGPPRQMTVPLAAPGRPVVAVPAPVPPEVAPPPAHRPRMPTVILRSRGPTRQQKLLVFMAMLLVFVSGGIAFLIYGRQLGAGFDAR